MSWFAIQTLPTREHRVKLSAERMGYTAECPVTVERWERVRMGNVVRQEVERPMYSGYIFIEADYVPDWMNKEDGIIRPLPSWKEPRALPESLVAAALSLSGTITVDEWREVHRLYSGDVVKRKGDDSGLTMTVDEMRGRNAVLLFEMLGKMHKKVVPASEVERVA